MAIAVARPKNTQVRRFILLSRGNLTRNDEVQDLAFEAGSLFVLLSRMLYQRNPL